MYQGPLQAVSNREDWIVPVTVLDNDTGDAIDITDATITVAVREQKSNRVYLTGTVGSGITITDATGGIFQWAFTPTQMRTLRPGTYDVGVVITDGGTTTQLFAGSVPVIDGVIT